MEHVFTLVRAVLAIAITFGLAVFVHEFGHMIFALIRGVGVESFAIGMGPKITSWTWKGIDFSLRWFPVGGFVKLGQRTPAAAGKNAVAAGDELGRGTATIDDVEVDRQAQPADEKGLTESAYDDLYALQDKSLLTKVMVFGGGVFMNLVTAILALAALALLGERQDLLRFEIDAVEPASAAAAAGLRAGDRVVAVNGRPVTYLQDFSQEVLKLYGAEPESLKTMIRSKLDRPLVDESRKLALNLTVERQGARQTLALPALDTAGFNDFMDGITTHIPPLVGNLQPNYPADRAGMKVGDMITSINGQPIHSFRDLNKIISASTGKPLTIGVDRQGKPLSFTMTPKGNPLEKERKGQIGIVNGSTEKRTVHLSNPLKALALAPFDAYSRVRTIITMNKIFFKHANFQDVRENVGGPIAIAAITAKQAAMGVRELINWFVTLNLLLMIFNLLPLPVLDGGFIVLSFIESAIRRPVPPRILGPVYTVFVICFIVLMVLISVQDVINWVPFKH